MYKYFSLFAVFVAITLTSCKTVLEINVENDLSGMGVVLVDGYKLTSSSKGYHNGDETRSFTLHISQQDAIAIANQIKTNEHFDTSFHDVEDEIVIDKNKKDQTEIAYSGKNGYVLYLVESNIFHAKLYVDTANNILHYEYLSNLY